MLVAVAVNNGDLLLFAMVAVVAADDDGARANTRRVLLRDCFADRHNYNPDGDMT